MEILKLINESTNNLKENKIYSSRLDAEILLSYVLKKSREKLLLNLDKKVTPNQEKYFKKIIKRRSLNEPVAYILKKKEFWSKDFFINKNTLIPRPETELLVEKVISMFKKKEKISLLDIGTGSGCILLSILCELKHATGIGVDVSGKALKIACKNSKKLGLINKAKFYNRSFLQLFNIKFDLIVSNPPYIEKKEIKNLNDDIKKFEPKLALDGGNDGLDVIKKVIYKSKSILKIKGKLALEIGTGQYKKVSNILKKNNFRVENLIQDYRNNIRCIISTLEK